MSRNELIAKIEALNEWERLIVLTNRFDSTAFKREYGELYKRFTKQISSRRFSIV